MRNNTEELSTDTVLHLLADERRRSVLNHLMENGEKAVEIEDLVAATTDTEESSEQVSIELHHVHLPRLAEEGIIDFDARSGSVRYRPISRSKT